MKIGIDLDGVTARFGQAFWSHLVALHGKEHEYTDPVGWYDWPPWT